MMLADAVMVPLISDSVYVFIHVFVYIHTHVYTYIHIVCVMASIICACSVYVYTQVHRWYVCRYSMTIQLTDEEFVAQHNAGLPPTNRNFQKSARYSIYHTQ